MFRSILNVSFVLVCICSCFKDIIAKDDCNKLGAHLYEDLACKPVGNKDCPDKFDCNLATPRSGCLFAGKNYASGDQIDDDLVYPACHVGCRCGSDFGTSPFTCAVLDCPEWLGSPIKPGCHRKYEAGKCCSLGEICPEEGNELATCNVDGTTYKEGERYYPKGTCLKCVCQKGFDGTFKEPACKKKVCAVQINSSPQLAENCAVYYSAKKGDVVCCPDGYVCAKGNEDIKEISDINKDITCQFGTKTLKKGEGFESEHINRYSSGVSKVQCECQLPPLVTCWNK